MKTILNYKTYQWNIYSEKMKTIGKRKNITDYTKNNFWLYEVSKEKKRKKTKFGSVTKCSN